MKRIKCEGVGDNNGFYVMEVTRETPTPQEERCYSCNGKGTYSQMHGIHGAWDFRKEEGFSENPNIHTYPCSACNGTGKKINTISVGDAPPTPKVEEWIPDFLKLWDDKDKHIPSWHIDFINELLTKERENHKEEKMQVLLKTREVALEEERTRITAIIDGMIENPNESDGYYTQSLHDLKSLINQL